MNNITRLTRTKFFYFSTLELLEHKVNKFLKEKELCPANFLDGELYMHDGVYQYVLVYVEVVEN